MRYYLIERHREMDFYNPGEEKTLYYLMGFEEKDEMTKAMQKPGIFGNDFLTATDILNGEGHYLLVERCRGCWKDGNFRQKSWYPTLELRVFRTLEDMEKASSFGARHKGMLIKAKMLGEKYIGRN